MITVNGYMDMTLGCNVLRAITDVYKQPESDYSDNHALLHECYPILHQNCILGK